MCGAFWQKTRSTLQSLRSEAAAWFLMLQISATELCVDRLIERLRAQNCILTDLETMKEPFKY